METQRRSNGWQTFHEHWGLAIFAVIFFFGVKLFEFFRGLNGAAWIQLYFAAIIVGGVGTAFIFYAKLPLYRQRQFFTFGSRALPERRRPFYRWGYCGAVSSAVLLTCLMLSRH